MAKRDGEREAYAARIRTIETTLLSIQPAPEPSALQLARQTRKKLEEAVNEIEAAVVAAQRETNAYGAKLREAGTRIKDDKYNRLVDKQNEIDLSLKQAITKRNEAREREREEHERYGMIRLRQRQSAIADAQQCGVELLELFQALTEALAANSEPLQAEKLLQHQIEDGARYDFGRATELLNRYKK